MQVYHKVVLFGLFKLFFQGLQFLDVLNVEEESPTKKLPEVFFFVLIRLLLPQFFQHFRVMVLLLFH